MKGVIVGGKWLTLRGERRWWEGSDADGRERGGTMRGGKGDTEVVGWKDEGERRQNTKGKMYEKLEYTHSSYACT